MCFLQDIYRLVLLILFSYFDKELKKLEAEERALKEMALSVQKKKQMIEQEKVRHGLLLSFSYIVPGI
jgi:hypothetical protein